MNTKYKNYNAIVKNYIKYKNCLEIYEWKILFCMEALINYKDYMNYTNYKDYKDDVVDVTWLICVRRSMNEK